MNLSLGSTGFDITVDYGLHESIYNSMHVISTISCIVGIGNVCSAGPVKARSYSRCRLSQPIINPILPFDDHASPIKVDYYLGNTLGDG